MIKFENGLVNISGKGIDILSEYAVITHEIKEMFVKNGGEEKDVKEQLRHSFEHGLMNEEFALLVGRLKAFEAWANSVKDYDFTKDIAFRMLGLGLEESKEEKKE